MLSNTARPISRRALAVLAGSITLPAVPALAHGAANADPSAPTALSAPSQKDPASSPIPPPAPPAAAGAAAGPAHNLPVPSESCLAENICAIKERVRWRTAAWSPSYCRLIARGVLRASEKYELSPALLLAVMMNESDLNERAVADHDRDGRLYARDSGLMGIRCLVDAQGKCTNGRVRGLPWTTVMDPLTNIELGARELRHYRDGAGGIMQVQQRIRDAQGRVVTKTRYVPCQHKTHAYWAHYNHGPRYIDKGPARHYPHRIGVLYYALADSMKLDKKELDTVRLTIRDPGARARTADRPVEHRFRKLCEKIREARGVCNGAVAAQSVKPAVRLAP